MRIRQVRQNRMTYTTGPNGQIAPSFDGYKGTPSPHFNFDPAIFKMPLFKWLAKIISQ